MRIRFAGTLAAVALGIAGCVAPEVAAPPGPVRTGVPPAQPPAATSVPAPVQPGAAGTVEPVPSPAPGRVAPPVSPASQALLTESRAHQAAGHTEQAAASIERALRIEPRQPVLWLELGNIRLQEGDYAQAESMGRKALSLSTGDAALAARAERLISDARRH